MNTIFTVTVGHITLQVVAETKEQAMEVAVKLVQSQRRDILMSEMPVGV